MKHLLITLTLLISLVAQAQQVDDVNSENVNNLIESKEWVHDLGDFSESENDHRPDDKTFEIEGNQFLFDTYGGENGQDQRYRDELRDAPWPLTGSDRTEKWLGWRYRVLDKVDDSDPTWYMITQFYQANINGGPPVGLYVTNKDRRLPKQSIGLNLEAHGGSSKYIDLNKKLPKVGGFIDIVWHVVFSKTRGLVQLWLDGELVYDEHRRTMFSGNSNVPNTKVGIYYMRGNNDGSYGEDYSYTFGVESIKQIMLSPGQDGYGDNHYELVDPANLDMPIDPDPTPPNQSFCPEGYKAIWIEVTETNGGKYLKKIRCVSDDKK